MAKRVIEITLLLCIFIKFSNSESINVCAKFSKFDQCQQLDRSEEIKCAKYYNNANCLTQMEVRNVSFGRVSSEDVLVSRNILKNIKVVGEVIGLRDQDATESFEIVVILKNKIKTVDELKTKRYCHPGFGKLQVNGYALKQFETTILDKLGIDRCEKNGDSLAEQHIKALSEFFGPSCRPGPWVDDPEIDAKLKINYKNLCELCSETSNNKCGTLFPDDPFSFAYDCLTKSGDIAITTKKIANKNINKLREYFFLLPDLTTVEVTDKPLSSSWFKKSFDFIVANKQDATDVIELLQDQLADKLNYVNNRQTSNGNGKFLSNILLEGFEKIRLVNPPVPSNEYVKKFMPTEINRKCKTNIRWCAISTDEYAKCNWFQEAVLLQGIYPGVSCVQKSDQLSCLKSIAGDSSDIIDLDNRYGFAARKKGLKSIAFAETKHSKLTKALVVLKHTDGKRSFADLKDKKACFSEFGDVAFMSFANVLESLQIIEIKCDYGKAISDFVGDSCAPGVKDSAHEAGSTVDQTKLCKCGGTGSCSTEVKINKYSGNSGALQCLLDIGQYAVITTKDIDNNGMDLSQFRVLCKNGTMASHNGLDVDEDCYTSVTTNTELVIRSNDDVLASNTKILLAACEKLFGENIEKSFELFNIFDKKLDLLFMDSTPGISFTEENKYIKNYVDVFKNHTECVTKNEPGSASSIVPVWLSLLCAIVCHAIL